jgi:hypothetical protein
VLATSVGTLVSCAEDESKRRPAPAVVTPAYQVVGTRDLNMGAVRRVEARVSLPEHYARDDVERVAQAIVADMTRSQRVNAIGLLFYGPQTSTSGAYDVAMVEWAPHGRWGDAGSVRAGDYSTFRYSVSYLAPTPTPLSGASRLAASNQTGLLGVPLQNGAKLIEQTRGDPATGRDPRQRYAIPASAAEIISFFTEVMPAAGWAKDGPSRPTSVFFRKGNLMIGVLTNRDGGAFTLMGS